MAHSARHRTGVVRTVNSKGSQEPQEKMRTNRSGSLLASNNTGQQQQAATQNDQLGRLP